MNPKAAFIRASEVLLAALFCYAVSAIVYTTNRFILEPFQGRLLDLSSSKQPVEPVRPKFTNWTLYQQPKLASTRSERYTEQPYVIPESLFMSKAFSTSLTPSEIIPYYYRASIEPEAEDITITTLITSNRFHVFAGLVDRYQGPISVTMHIKNETNHVQDTLDALRSLYSSSPHMALFVDVHLVIDSFDRQFNTWRNIARLFARTDFVMMLDVDFYLCTDFRSAIRKSKPILQKLRDGNAAFVIPAFEYPMHSDGSDFTKFPNDKKALLPLVKSKKISMFHDSWQAGHNSTDYTRFYAAQAGEVYKVTRYQSAYEPYVVSRADSPPWCDERFVGYGGNKAACLYEMYLSGINFYVLADHFLIHQNHVYQEVIRKNERRFNRRLYNDFREEACLRYLKAFHEAGLLNTTQGYNAQDECKHMKGISRTVAQLIEH